ncbi:MAG: DUF2461 domain-containing protein [Bacteroidia bacterium]|nr:DUF2461 domain-containing protein [Bacteroidia bacterium]
MQTTIPASVFYFLKELSKNNNRDWFAKHKDRYISEHECMIAFADALLAEMNRHDHIETPSGKRSLYRIYKDTRFSKDKTPYKNNFSGGFRRATKKLRGGYYFHIQPGNTYVAGGFFGPNPEDLKRIREDIARNYEDWRKLFADKSFKQTFNKLQGEQVQTSPKGFSKDHPAIDLLRYKQFILKHSFTDKEVLAPGFLEQVNKTFKSMRPFFNYMSEVLTTDLNGVEVG